MKEVRCKNCTSVLEMRTEDFTELVASGEGVNPEGAQRAGDVLDFGCYGCNRIIPLDEIEKAVQESDDEDDKAVFI